MKTLFGISLAVGLFCGAGSANSQAGGWSEHRNDKFGYRLEYPSELFKLERTAESGDGHVFVSISGDARLLVGALINSTSITPAAYQDHVARESYGKFKVTYRPLGRSWLVLSGEGEGKIFYEKVIFSCSGQLMNSFAIIYPVERRDVFDPIIERMENSFHAGAACEHARSPTVRRTPRESGERVARKSKQMGSSRQPEPGQWIVRGRGPAGHVILQHTSPPYERKVVRGQAY